MTTKKAKSKKNAGKQAKEAEKAKEAAEAATPPTDEAQAPAAAETTQAEEQAQAAIAAETAKAKEAAEAAKPVLVLVGPDGAAGRIVFNRVVYDGVTPRPMARADFERLRAQYDLQEVKE